MHLEIERKFLVTSEAYKALDQGELFRQGYFAHSKKISLRVRLEGERATLTIKGKTVGISRTETEFTISKEEAAALLATLPQENIVEKIRRKIPYAGHIWEVDEFLGANAGLVVAEIELSRENEPFEKPSWVGKEVSEDKRYTNVALSIAPYNSEAFKKGQ